MCASSTNSGGPPLNGTSSYRMSIMTLGGGVVSKTWKVSGTVHHGMCAL
jgi:hypothetical protein